MRQYAARHADKIYAHFRLRNIGAACNAYSLIQKARGEYLAFCEGDDFWLTEDKLSQQVRFLDSNPAFIGCSHRCRVVDGDGIALKKQKISAPDEGGIAVQKAKDLLGKGENAIFPVRL